MFLFGKRRKDVVAGGFFSCVDGGFVVSGKGERRRLRENKGDRRRLRSVCTLCCGPYYWLFFEAF